MLILLKEFYHKNESYDKIMNNCNTGHLVEEGFDVRLNSKHQSQEFNKTDCDDYNYMNMDYGYTNEPNFMNVDSCPQNTKQEENLGTSIFDVNFMDEFFKQ